MYFANQKQKKIKREIRDFEADMGIEASKINLKRDGSVSVTFPKHVLYHYNKDAHKWFRTFRANDVLNCNIHANTIEQKLADKGIKNTVVTVKRQFKTLPIPFIEIPIKVPFINVGWRKVGTRVRAFQDVAVQPTSMSITFDKNTVQNTHPSKILSSIQAAAVVSESGEGKSLPTASRRASYSPIKWLLRGLSHLTPRFLSKIIPNKVKNISRPKPHGYYKADNHLNTPFINGGALAHTVNISAVTAGIAAAVAAAVAALVAACFCMMAAGRNGNCDSGDCCMPGVCGADLLLWDSSINGGNNGGNSGGNQNQNKNSSSNSKLGNSKCSIFAATCVKISQNNSQDKQMNGVLLSNNVTH